MADAHRESADEALVDTDDTLGMSAPDPFDSLE